MNRHPRRAAALLALAALLVVAPAAAEESAAPAADLSAFAWLSGCWSGWSGDTFMEEHWTTPAGDGLVGMHKDVTAGRMSGFEHFRIAPVEDAGVCYLSSPGGAPPTRFCLVEQGPERAVFENREHDYPQRVLYWRDGERLRARIEGTVGGVRESAEWSWERCR